MPEGKNGKREDPKVAFDTARAIATISIAVAAFFISVAGVTFWRFPSDGAVIESTQKGATVAMVTVALLSLICAANCIDWIMDHIKDEQWTVPIRLTHTPTTCSVCRWKSSGNQGLRDL